MRYVKFIDKTNGNLCVGTGGCGGTAISKDEYECILAEIREKATLVNQLYNGEITIDAVPEEWREEIQRRVDERIANEGTLDEQDIPAEEALEIILGGEA